MRLEAHAKINIGLLVGEKRTDGFHDIKTIMALISLKDIIDAECVESDSFSVTIDGNDSYLASGVDLMEKSALLYHEKTGLSFSLRLSIEKHIPPMAGLGGGSSDAAAVLGFLDSFFGNYLGRNRLLSLSSRVGSDVPFFVSGYHGAFVTGRGEIIEECDTPHGKKLVLFIPEYGHSTVSAYNILDKIPRKERNLLGLSEFFPSRETHPNDFELVFPSPFPVDFQEKLEKEGAYFSMTGSGSAWYALFPGVIPLKFDNLEKYDIVSAYII